MKNLGISLVLVFLFGCSTDTRPNVLLLTLDTLRADALGCYGNTQIDTPNLDRLASEGVLFEDAICQIPATLTSHTAIMTGRNPKTTGVRFAKMHVPDNEFTLADEFFFRNYRTAAFISSMVLSPEYGLNQGFSIYSLGSMQENNLFERRAEDTVDEALRFFDQTGSSPFFAWIHLYDPHTPYDAPPPFHTKYDPDYTGPVRGSVSEITAWNARNSPLPSQRDLQHVRALYHGEVSYMDHHIGRLLKGLEEKHRLDNTIIVALADHGEALGEKGHFFHGSELYRHATRIPMIIRYPKLIEAGTRVPSLVQSTDIYPTILKMAGYSWVSSIEGSSLLSLINPEEQDTYQPHPGYLETEVDVLCDANKLYGLRTDTAKFIYNQAHRREETPIGLSTRIPLKGPSVVLLRIQGDPSMRLMTHIRYRTQETYTSNDPQQLAHLNTTVVHGVSWGTDPLHREIEEQTSFLKTPEGWRLQATPDIYSIAYRYGKSNGWPTDWMVLEGVGVDASIPAKQQEAQFHVDQIELYAPGLRYPDSPRFRKPFWVIENFEDIAKQGLIDSNQGPSHSIASTWRTENLFMGKRQQHIHITFQDTDSVQDELYLIVNDALEEHNRILDNEALAQHCTALLDAWIEKTGDHPNALYISPANQEALEALGYVQ